MTQVVCRGISVLALCVAISASPARAQTSVTVAGREIQAHGSIQQGFVVSGANNFLTMDTSRGSAEMTDGAFNVSTQATKKLRMGAQIYGRHIGQLGDGRPQLDWAYADYRFADAAGVRVGKVKTALGLFNDTQDLEFLHTWALLPQSVYPADLRAVTIAHVGADLYGSTRLSRGGSLAYQVYAGRHTDDSRSGLHYGLADAGSPLTKNTSGWTEGADVRWTTAVPSLMVGASVKSAQLSYDFLDVDTSAPFRWTTAADWTQAVYGEWAPGSWRLSAEFRQQHQQMNVFDSPHGDEDVDHTHRGWFAALAYRVRPWMEVGSYYGDYRFIEAHHHLDEDTGGNFIYDRAITARFDPKSFWSVKVEGHFMQGVGSLESTRGFYLRSNPSELQPSTNMLVLRTGLSF